MTHRTATALAIAGCYVMPLETKADERGSILKVWRRDGGIINPEDIGEVYLSTVKPGVVKAWHLHHAMTLRYVCVSGRVLVGLYDNRQDCPTRGTTLKVHLECFGTDYQMLVVPPGVWNGFRSVGEVTSVVLNLPDMPHDPLEIERVPRGMRVGHLIGERTTMPGDEYLFIFDKDGTLVTGPKGGPPNSVAEQLWLPNVQEKCRSLVDGGHTLAVASNQGGVAMGLVTYEQAEAMVRWVAQQIGAVFYEFCPYHPKGTVPEFTRDDNCRKPGPGMLQNLQLRTGMPWHRIIFVGNGIEDWQASLMAGCQFVWASDFF